MLIYKQLRASFVFYVEGITYFVIKGEINICMLTMIPVGIIDLYEHYAFLLSGPMISWSSKKQFYVTLSTMSQSIASTISVIIWL